MIIARQVRGVVLRLVSRNRASEFGEFRVFDWSDFPGFQPRAKHCEVLPGLNSMEESPAIFERSPVQIRRDSVVSALDFSPVRAGNSDHVPMSFAGLAPIFDCDQSKILRPDPMVFVSPSYPETPDVVVRLESQISRPVYSSLKPIVADLAEQLGGQNSNRNRKREGAGEPGIR